jgi:hypothetical protein
MSRLTNRATVLWDFSEAITELRWHVEAGFLTAATHLYTGVESLGNQAGRVAVDRASDYGGLSLARLSVV